MVAGVVVVLVLPNSPPPPEAAEAAAGAPPAVCGVLTGEGALAAGVVPGVAAAVAPKEKPDLADAGVSVVDDAPPSFPPAVNNPPEPPAAVLFVSDIFDAGAVDTLDVVDACPLLPPPPEKANPPATAGCAAVAAEALDLEVCSRS